MVLLNGLFDAFRRSRSKAMQVALTLFFSLSSIAVPTLIGDEAFGNLILTVAGRLQCAGEVCVFFFHQGNPMGLFLFWIYNDILYTYIN